MCLLLQFSHDDCTPLCVGYLANIESPTLPIIYSVVVISVGTAGTCTFNAEFNIIGILVMFAAELAEAIRLIFTQYFLQQLKFGVVEGLEHLLMCKHFIQICKQ